jgi:hypothetical protein
MTRWRWYVPAVVLAIASAGGVGWIGSEPQPAAELLSEEFGIPDLWQWKLHSVPDPGVPAELQLVLRSRVAPLGPEDVAWRADRPLRTGEGTDRVIGAEILTWPPGGHRVTVQVLDLRRFGAGPDEGSAPLRATGAVTSGEAAWQTSATLRGHSLVGRPAVHADTWKDGELALITLATVAADTQYAYTFLLTVRPNYR